MRITQLNTFGVYPLEAKCIQSVAQMYCIATFQGLEETARWSNLTTAALRRTNAWRVAATATLTPTAKATSGVGSTTARPKDLDRSSTSIVATRKVGCFVSKESCKAWLVTCKSPAKLLGSMKFGHIKCSVNLECGVGAIKATYCI